MPEKEMSEKPYKEKMKDELKKIKGLSWGQRIVYFWDYYKIVIVIVIAVIVAIQLGRTIVRNMNTDELLNVAFLNTSYTMESTEALEEAFADYLGGIEKNQKITLDFSYSLNPGALDNYTIATQTKLTALMADRTLDAMVLPETIYEQYQREGVFGSLDEMLTPDEQQLWEERLRREKQSGTQTEKIYALQVNDLPALENVVFYSEEPMYLAIVTNSEHMDMTMRFLHFLMEG